MKKNCPRGYVMHKGVCSNVSGQTNQGNQVYIDPSTHNYGPIEEYEWDNDMRLDCEGVCGHYQSSCHGSGPYSWPPSPPCSCCYVSSSGGITSPWWPGDASASPQYFYINCSPCSTMYSQCMSSSHRASGARSSQAWWGPAQQFVRHGGAGGHRRGGRIRRRRRR